MRQALFKLFLALVVFGILAFPIFQLLQTGGYLFYCNGLDESAYLQYDYSKLVSQISGLARIGQFIVNSLHEIGLSAGWINLLFDLTIISSIIFLLLKILKLLGYSKEDSQIAVIILFGIPILFSGINPLVKYLSHINQTTDLIYWFSMPDASNHPFMRSPEPQISYLILVIGILLTLYFKNFIYAYVVAPLLYPFIAIPYLFCVLSIQLKLRKSNGFDFIIPITSFVVIGILVATHSNYFVTDYVKSYMVNTNLPLISGMGILALLIHVILNSKLDSNRRFISWILVLSNFVAVNTQVFSGWLIQSSNYEQYWGVITVALMITLHLPKLNFRSKLLLSAFSLILLSYSMFYAYSYNMQIFKRIVWSEDLLDTLRQDPSQVAIDDIAVSSWLSMIFPKQPALLFTLIRSYKTLGDLNFERYLCAKKFILENANQNGNFNNVIMELDAAYSSGHKYSPLYTNLRKPFLIPERDLNTQVKECAQNKLRIFLIRP